MLFSDESHQMHDLSHLIGLLLLAAPGTSELPFEADEEDLLPDIPPWPSIYAQQVAESDPHLCAPVRQFAHLSHL